MTQNLRREESLNHIGWSPVWENTFRLQRNEGLIPARVSCEHRGLYSVLTEHGEWLAEVSGRMRHNAEIPLDMPAVGDWVAAQPHAGESRCTIHGVLPRRSAFVRKAAGDRTEEQVVAANVDTVFLVSGLDHDFNLRRIERYLTLSYSSGVAPVILLNKADLCENRAQTLAEAESVARGAPVLLVSATKDEGIAKLLEYLPAGTTGALLGSSGVGKSALINALIGHNVFKTQPVREKDSRGRHTTTRRQLIPLSNGAALIDTPGMREIQLWADGEALGHSFGDIEGYAPECRFSDCSHTGEPGCAVQRALAAGLIGIERFESYLRQRKELRHLQIQQDVRLQIGEKKRWKAILRTMKDHHKWKSR